MTPQPSALVGGLFSTVPRSDSFRLSFDRLGEWFYESGLSYDYEDEQRVHHTVTWTPPTPLEVNLPGLYLTIEVSLPGFTVSRGPRGPFRHRVFRKILLGLAGNRSASGSTKLALYRAFSRSPQERPYGQPMWRCAFQQRSRRARRLLEAADSPMARGRPPVPERGRDYHWTIMDPLGALGTIGSHEVTEHEDGTITVHPSIHPSIDDAPAGYHGCLVTGEWSP